MNETITLATVRTSGHPWIFRRMLAKGGRRPPNGAAVDVRDRNGAFVGVGLYSSRSSIAVRLVGDEEGRPVDRAFLRERFEALRALKEELAGEGTDAFRLVNSEGDGLSGLIVDKFGKVFTADVRAWGWYARLDEVRGALEDAFGEVREFHAVAPAEVKRTEGFELPPPPAGRKVEFRENGLRFRFVLEEAHKTGSFLDQRENRALVRRLARGRVVLDCCCYTGGFALNAAAGGAESVCGVDLDEKAVAAAKKNADLNGLRVRFVHADVFPYLRDRVRAGNLADLLVLDPPKLIRSRAEFDEGRRVYYDMNRTAMAAVRKGGFLFSFSCSGLLGEEAFLKMLREAAWAAGRQAQVLRLVGAAPDHPFLLTAPEGRYLKGALLRLL